MREGFELEGAHGADPFGELYALAERNRVLEGGWRGPYARAKGGLGDAWWVVGSSGLARHGGWKVGLLAECEALAGWTESMDSTEMK